MKVKTTQQPRTPAATLDLYSPTESILLLFRFCFLTHKVNRFEFYARTKLSKPGTTLRTHKRNHTEPKSLHSTEPENAPTEGVFHHSDLPGVER